MVELVNVEFDLLVRVLRRSSVSAPPKAKEGKRELTPSNSGRPLRMMSMAFSRFSPSNATILTASSRFMSNVTTSLSICISSSSSSSSLHSFLFIFFFFIPPPLPLERPLAILAMALLLRETSLCEGFLTGLGGRAARSA